MMNFTKLLATFCAIAIFSTVQAQTLTLGIVPQQSAKKLARLWTPICTYLSKKVGHEIRFSTANDIPTFEKRVLEGQYDIAYMNPYHYTVFHERPGYEAIAKQKNKRIKGIIVVPKDSKLTSLQELDGNTLAFPAPAAFAASVLPRAKIAKEGIKITPQYVSSHDSVYLTVSRKIFPAGGGIQRTLSNTSTEVSDQLRILWTTPGYTPHAIATHPDLDTKIKNKLQKALIEMNTDPEGQALLKSISFKGMEIADNKDWDDVRDLNITLLEHLLK